MVRITKANSIEYILKFFFIENIRELVNTVRTEIGALIDGDQKNSKDKIESSDNNEKSTSLNNQNINISAVNTRQAKKKSR